MPDLVGKTLGKYRILERLGRGGMAEVYRAYHPGLDRYVAIKVMHGYLAEDESFVGRFKREAKAVASLHHPNIVQVYDFDIEDDIYYMVMEYIQGETLKARLERMREQGQRMTVDEVMRIFHPLCDALNYAHTQGRYHRDIKPANIMFDGDRLVLTDFGIATILGGTRYTQSGAMVGTPVYMSPEQGMGKPSDSRSDVYSLGIVLYELLTGRVPYDADTPYAIILKHINEPLPLPSEVMPTLAPALENVILKALAKSPDDRFATPNDLFDALNRATAEAGTSTQQSRSAAGVSPSSISATVIEPVAAVETRLPPASPVRARKNFLPHFLILGGLSLFAVFVIGIVSLFIFVFPAGQPISKDLTSPPETQNTSSGSTVPGNSVPADPNAKAMPFYRAGLAALQERNDFQAAIDQLTQAIKADPKFARAYYQRGIAYIYNGQSQEAEDDFNQAISLEPEFADAFVARGLLYLRDKERPDDALKDFNQAIQLDPQNEQAYLQRGYLYRDYRGEMEPAMEDFSRAAELNPQDFEPFFRRGEMYLYQDSPDKAKEDLLRATELNPDGSSIWYDLGLTYYKLGDYAQSVSSYDKAISLEPAEISFFFDRAFANLAANHLPQALEDYNKVLLLEPDKLPARFGRGIALAKSGKFEEAIADFTKVIDSKSEDFQTIYIADSHPYLERALAYQKLGQMQEALGDLNTLVQLFPDSHLPYYYRGLFYKDTGDTASAAADMRKAWEQAPDETWRNKIEAELKALEK